MAENRTARGADAVGRAAAIAGITFASFIDALAVAARLAQTSDSANSFVAGHAIAGGNVLLSGWHFPLDDYYFTDALPYGVLGLLCGPRPFLLVLLPALTYALFVLAVLLVCIGRNKPLAANLVSCAAIALLLGTPSWTGLWNPLLLSDMHMGTVLGAFVGLALCTQVEGARNTPFLTAAGLVILTIATMASDPFALVFAFAPALAILFGEAISHPGSRGVWTALMLLVIGTVAGWFLPRLIANGGGFTTENDVLLRPETLPHLGRNLVAVVMGILTLFGANPSGTGIGFREILLLALRGTGLIVAAAAVLRLGRNFFARRQPALLDRMLCAAILTVLAACVLSAQFAKGITPQNSWSGGPPMRFLVPAYLFAAVLAGRQAPRIFAALPQTWVQSGLALGAALSLFGANWLSRVYEQPLWIAGNAPATAARWLQQHDLSEGVGEYWSANLVTAMSGNAVQIRSVVPDAGRLVSYVWVEDARWYGQTPQFVIWQDNNKTAVAADEVQATYPVRRIATVAGYRIALLSTGHSRPAIQFGPPR